MAAKLGHSKFQQNEPTTTFRADNGDIIKIEVENSLRGFYWRMSVNGEMSEVYSYYQGILSFRGYNIATAYWAGTFPEFIPFTIETTTEEKTNV